MVGSVQPRVLYFDRVFMPIGAGSQALLFWLQVFLYVESLQIPQFPSYYLLLNRSRLSIFIEIPPTIGPGSASIAE